MVQYLQLISLGLYRGILLRLCSLLQVTERADTAGLCSDPATVLFTQCVYKPCSARRNTKVRLTGFTVMLVSNGFCPCVGAEMEMAI